MSSIKDKVAIITGSGKGIGRAIAETFADNGAIVIIATIAYDEGTEVEKAILAKGGRAQFIQTDVAQESQIIALVDTVANRYGKIDILINNAGVTLFKPIFDATLADWDKIINIDLRGVFLCSKYTAQHMVKHGIAGAIVNISSNHAHRTLPDTEIYAAAKGGVNAMTRSMAISLGKYGIRVNAVCPGFTDTHHYQRWLAEKENPEKVADDIKKMHATGEICEPTDIANLALFLVTDQSKKITGAEILIDGGLTARLYTSDTF